MPVMECIRAVRERANYIKCHFSKADKEDVNSHYKSGALVEHCGGWRSLILHYIAKNGFKGELCRLS